MSTVGPQTDDSTDDADLPGDSSEWDEEWLPEWVNVADDDPAPEQPAPEQPAPELEEQLAADLEAVQRLVASLLTESGAAFAASVGGWEPDEPEDPDEPEEPPAPVEPASDLSSVGFSMGVARPVPAAASLPEPPPVPAVVSPPAPRRRRWGWLVAPLVLLLAGVVVGTFLWAGSSRRPTPAAAVRAELGSSSTLPTWSRPADFSPTGPVPVRTTPSASDPVPSVSPVHRAARRAAATTAHTTSPVPAAPTATTPAAPPTETSGNPSSCSSAAHTDTTPTQTTEPAPTTTDTATPTGTTSATDTTTQTTTQTETQTTSSQPSLLPAASCAP